MGMIDLPKPETVEIGQWWLLRYLAINGPVRITGRCREPGGRTALYDGGWSRDHSILSLGVYLGNGEHPAPSDEMIETLIDAMFEIEDGGIERDGLYRANMRRVVLDVLENRCRDLTYSRCIGVIYRLLRARGEW